jgi:hypothetical protein
LTFRQKINTEYLYKEIDYLTKDNNSEYKYSEKRGTTNINDIYTNAELPNLRANFIKEVFQEKYQMNDLLNREIDILDGSISQDTTFTSRNVKIFLYLTH